MSNETEREKQDMDTDVMETNNELPAGPPPKRFQRSRDDRMIAGVAGGLAKHLNIDPLIVRIGFVAASFAGGLGVLLYIVGWLLVPEEGAAESLGASASEPLKSIPRWLLAGIVGIAAIALISGGWGDLGWGEQSFLWALLLIGGGILLYRADTAAPKPPPSSDEGGGAIEPTATVSDAAITTRMPVTTPTRPKPRRERSYLGRYTFAAMLLILGVTAMLDMVGTFNHRVEQYPAIALFVVGAGLLVGTFIGRSRSIIFLGILIIPLALISTLVRVPMEGGVGERSYMPVVVDRVEDVYRLAAGRMKFDFTDFRWGAEPVKLEATVVAGSIEIVVPQGVTVDFEGRVGAGRIDFFQEHRDGYNVDFGSTFGDSQTGPLLLIDTEVSFGYIEVTHRPK